MSFKKIRGHRRRHRQIEKWRQNYLSIDLTDYLLTEQERCYAKCRLYPWTGSNSTIGVIPWPKGKTKQKLLNALFDIYKNWKLKLDDLRQPYYLKFWLYDPRVSESEVVCAIGKSIDFYKEVFFKPDDGREFKPDNFGHIGKEFANLNWNHFLDEWHYEPSELDNTEFYPSLVEKEKAKKKFNKFLKRPHRIYNYQEEDGEIREFLAFKQGDVWVGGK